MCWLLALGNLSGTVRHRRFSSADAISDALRAHISDRQRAMLEGYSYEAVRARLVACIEKFLRQ